MDNSDSDISFTALRGKEIWPAHLRCSIRCLCTLCARSLETHMMQLTNKSDDIWKKIDALRDLKQSKNLHVILLCMATQA